MSEQRQTAGKIVLVQYPGLTARSTLSPFCGKAQMALGVKGVDYTVRNLFAPIQARRYNLRGRVPVLLIDGTATVDSSDIVAELDRRFPDPPLRPESPRDRAQAYVLEDWADEVLYFFGLYLRWIVDENYARMRREVLGRLAVPARWFAPLIARRTVTRRAAGQGIGVKDRASVEREFEVALDALAVLLDGRDYLVGARLTHADLAVCAMIDQLRIERLTPAAAARIAARAPIVTWAERVHRLAPNAAEP